MNYLSNLEEKIMATCLLITFIGGMILAWAYYIDGIYVNRVLTFKDGVDPGAMVTEKDVYHPGEMVRVKTSFCKNRSAIASTQWTLANEELKFFAPSEPRELETGCFGPTFAAIRRVPEDATAGSHYFTGVSTQILPDGRVRQQYYRTVDFQVELREE
jgi:hypothetical protein